MSPRAAVLPLVLVGLLAGCATPFGGGSSTNAIVPPTTSMTAPAEVTAAWLDGGRLVGVVTYGSSSCVPAATDAAVGPAGTLTVTLADPDGPCTKDYAPRVTLVQTPADVDASADLEISLTGGYSGTADLAAAPGLSAGGETDYLPSAGWTGEDDQLVVLTWGSSSCLPVVESVTPMGPAEVTVLFETPPADQVCTADIGPRALVAAAPGLEDGVSARLTLAGGRDFATPVTIPVVGTP